jgi:hypothetical protein
MGIYKDTYYVAFSKDIDFEPDAFCNRIAELYYCNVHYSLDTDDENSQLPLERIYNFDRAKSVKIHHSIYVNMETTDDSGTWFCKYDCISYDIDFSEIFNKEISLTYNNNGFIQIYLHYILWQSISLSYYDYFDESMKSKIMHHRPIALNILKNLGCKEALILPDCLCEVTNDILFYAVEADNPINSFAEMKEKLRVAEEMHYYNVGKLLDGTEEISNSTKCFQTGFYDSFNC